MPEPVSVLVLGGSGVFGERACRRLARTPGLRVLLAGRDERKAETAAAAIARDVPSADIQGIGLPADRLEAFLAQSRPSVVLLVAGSGDGPLDSRHPRRPRRPQACARATAAKGGHGLPGAFHP